MLKMKFDDIYKKLLTEASSDVRHVGIFPGAFKPPHIGHYYTTLDACKNNDLIYIYVSNKARALSTQNKSGGSGGDCDMDRYSNFMKNDKYTSNLLSIKPAACARMTSASALRAAITVKDKNTIFKNIPESVDQQTVYDILMQSNDISSPTYGHISIDQTMEIWRLYQAGLIRESGKSDQQIHILVSQISPVRDTYELVNELNNDEAAGMTSVNLYVGT